MNTKLGESPVYPSAADELVDHPVYGYTTKASLGSSGPTGITLRHHYAGLAMQAILSNASLSNDMKRLGWDDLSKYPKWAVEHADALLAELEKTA